MEIQIKVPNWVNTEDEGVCMLFAFLRKLCVEYESSALDVYGYDIRRIIGSEDDGVHLTLNELIDTSYCKIAKLNREHFVFKLRQYRTGVKTVTLKKHQSHIIWAYLAGCSNWNLTEPDNDTIRKDMRPHYTPMYRFDQEMFKSNTRK